MKLKNPFILLALIFLILLVTSCQDDSEEFLADGIHSEIDKEFMGQNKRVCLSHEHTQRLLEDPDYRSAYNKRVVSFEKYKASAVLKSACVSPIVVPVAIHFQGVSNPNRSCLVTMAQNQIDILNVDYRGTNVDISNWKNNAAAAFPGVSNGEMCVEFVLADKNHPGGYGLSNGDVAVTINKTQGESDNKWKGYVNIFVQQNTGGLGSSPFGGSGNGDGIVIDYTGFGSGAGCGSVAPDNPFDLGRTLTHEMGHYLFLDHIWGENTNCNSDDGVADTPDQSQDSYGCPTIGSSSCGSKDLHMNYMDYTNDACMYMFSAGQVTRMTNYLNANLKNVTNNASNVYSGSTNTGGDDSTGGDDTSEGDDTDGNDDNNDEDLTCTSPQNSNVTILSEVKVKIDWADIHEATKYRVRYRVFGTGKWTVKATNSSQKTLDGLAASDYEYQLRTRCADGWKPWSTKEKFSLSSDGGSDDTSGNGFGTYQIQVTLDNYGSETSWELYDADNKRIANGGPYADNKAGQIKTKSIELSDGCYEIDLFDDYGDGICCDEGNGRFDVINPSGQSIVSSDGNFGSYELVSFCVENGKARIISRDKDTKKLSRGKK